MSDKIEMISNSSVVFAETNPLMKDGVLYRETDTNRLKMGTSIQKYNDAEYIEWYPKYLEYTVVLTQSGTSAPVATILKNTVGEMVWARTAAGTYTLTKVGSFKEGKTVPNSDTYVDADGNVLKVVRTSDDVMTLTTHLETDTETPADDVMTNQYFSIQIYL